MSRPVCILAKFTTPGSYYSNISKYSVATFPLIFLVGGLKQIRENRENYT